MKLLVKRNLVTSINGVATRKIVGSFLDSNDLEDSLVNKLLDKGLAEIVKEPSFAESECLGDIDLDLENDLVEIKKPTAKKLGKKKKVKKKIIKKVKK